jgi:hypothetical protein
LARTEPIALLAPGVEAGFLGDVAIPAELYFLARDPVALAGMAYPARVDWQALHAAGLRRVVCLTHDGRPPYDPAPLTARATALEDLWNSPAPADPVVERERVLTAAGWVVDAIRAGEGVVVHCRGGRGRTGTVLGAALVLLGHEPGRVISHLDALHTRRGKLGWPESPWQSALLHLISRGDPRRGWR